MAATREPAAPTDAPAGGTAPAGPGTSYEQARDELAQVVARLESGGLPLEESLTLWERGEHLAEVCRQLLDGARQRVEAALARADEENEA